MSERASGRDCRGWPLVRTIRRLSAEERAAAQGHLALCRRCTARLEAEKALEQRLATAGSVTLGVGIAAIAARIGGKAASAVPLAGASFAPVVVLSTAAVLTAGAGGALAAARHTHPAPQHERLVQPVAPGSTRPSTAPTSGTSSVPAAAPSAPNVPSTSGIVPPGTSASGPALAPSQRTATSLPLPLPTGTGLPTRLPTVVPTGLPTVLPLPTVSVPALPVGSAVPTVTSVLPLPTLSVPPELLPSLP